MLIDISHYQGVIDWQKAVTDADGFYVKVSEGTSYVDPSWLDYYDAARARAIPLGPYHFADGSDPIQEANHFADQYLSRVWQLVPTLDAERSFITADWIVRFRQKFRYRMRTGLGWPGDVPYPFRGYVPYFLLLGSLNPDFWIDPQTSLWAARHNDTLGWNHSALVLWQNGGFSEPGFVGSVDTDQYMNGWTPAADLRLLTPPTTGGTMGALQPDDHTAIQADVRFVLQGGDPNADRYDGRDVVDFLKQSEANEEALSAKLDQLATSLAAVAAGLSAKIDQLAATVAAAKPTLSGPFAITGSGSLSTPAPITAPATP